MTKERGDPGDRNAPISVIGIAEIRIKGVAAANLNDTKVSGLAEDQLRKSLLSLWGVGSWTVDMILIFYLGLPDIWSEADAGLKRAISLLLPDNSEQQKALLESCKPYRSYLALHLWHGLDNKYLG